MNKFQLIFKACVFGAILFVSASAALAQATRTWVSGLGDDVNPCSRTAPCKTFAGAISKTAAGGEINALDPAGYGTLTVTKSMTVDGAGTNASTLAAGTSGFIINAPNSEVRLRNITINGAGTGTGGIRIIAANRVFIENVLIDGFTQNGITIESAAAKVSIKNTIIRNAQGNCVNADGTDATVLIADSSFEGCAAGVSATKANVTVIHSVVAFNEVGIQSGAGATVRLSNVTVTNNACGLNAVSGGSIISFKNNAIGGNTKDGAPTTSVSLQ